jgi:DNA-binding SARP family transcriptional activator/TolB-like protein
MPDNPSPSSRLAAQPSSSGQTIVRLRLIGQLEAWTVTGASVLPPGRKTRALLAVIAMSLPRPATRGRLADLLWSRRPEEQARASLRQEIHRLQEALQPAGPGIVLVTRDHLTLRSDAIWTDVEEVMHATAQQPAALALVDGNLLEDLNSVDPTFDSWLSIEREHLRDRARTIAETLLQESNKPELALPAAHRLLEIDRAHEGAWRALMRAHIARGERGMAVQAYDRCRAALADRLDTLPSQETQKLLAEIRGPYGSQVPAPRSPLPLDATAPEPEAAPPAEDPQHNPLAVLEPTLDCQHSRGGTRIGVLPPEFPDAHQAEAHLAPGLAEEITTALSRFRGMFVIASSSLARFASETRDELAIRRAFGLDFLLDGLIQHVGNRFRITVHLLDLRAGAHVAWARRFDGQFDDLLTLQDEISAEVVAQIDSEIPVIESRRSATRPAVDATAYHLVLRAIPLIGRLDRAQFISAGENLGRAIELEPDYAAPHAWYAYWNVFLVGQAWTEEPDAAAQRAGHLAERAIVLDPFDANALTIAGHVRAFLHHRPREAVALHDRALTLNPNLAMAWALSACAHAYLGDADEAERRLNRYKKLSPFDPQTFFFDAFFIYIHILKRDFDAAVMVGRTVSEMNPAFSASHRLYLAALGLSGREQEAAAIRQRLLGLEPDFTIERLIATSPLARETDRELVAQGLRRAGIAERSH